jgi:hypothetical protein
LTGVTLPARSDMLCALADLTREYA